MKAMMTHAAHQLTEALRVIGILTPHASLPPEVIESKERNEDARRRFNLAVAKLGPIDDLEKLGQTKSKGKGSKGGQA